MSLTWELSAPRIVAFEHAEQSRVRGRLLRAAVNFPRRWRDGPVDRAMLRAGCASRHRRGVCARAGTRTGSGSTRCGRSGRPRSSCWPCATGWRRTGSRTWRWRARACTGSPCSTCSRRPSRVCSSTPLTSSRSRGGRPTSRTACGSRNAWSAGCCGAASCRRRRFASSAT